MYFFLTPVKVVESFDNNVDNPTNNRTDDNININNPIEIEKECNNQINIEISKNNKLNNNINQDSNQDINQEYDVDNHFISVVYIKKINNIEHNLPNKIPISLYQIIIKKNREIPTFEIDFSPDFKYKKYIREKSVLNFSLKKTDIISIKHINTVHNFHNYLVILADTYNNPNIIQCEKVPLSKDVFSWKTFYHIDCNEKYKGDFEIFNSYSYKIELKDSLSKKYGNSVLLGDIYNTIKGVC